MRRSGTGDRLPITTVPDLVNAGVAAVLDIEVPTGFDYVDRVYLLLNMESHVLEGGLVAIVKAGLANSLLKSIVERLDRIKDGGHRGELIQHLVTLKLRLHRDLRGAVAALVTDAGRASGSPPLPDWYASCFASCFAVLLREIVKPASCIDLTIVLGLTCQDVGCQDAVPFVGIGLGGGGEGLSAGIRVTFLSFRKH